MKRNKWNSAEIEVLEDALKKGVLPNLPDRSINAIKIKMRKLGLLYLKRWTEEEVKTLMQKNTVPSRSKKAIIDKLAKLGLRKRREHRASWSNLEVEQLKKLHSTGKSATEIHSFFKNRTKDSIQHKISKLNLTKKKGYTPPWSSSDIEKLKNLHNEGKSALDIHRSREIENHSLNSIQKKLCRLGLAKKIINFVKFPKDVRLKFKNFLIENWEGKTPEDLVELWNKKNDVYKTNKSKVVTTLTDLKIKIPYYEVYRMNTLREKEKKIVEENKDSAKILEEKIRRERIKMMRERAERGRDIWTGMMSPEEKEEAI